MLLTENPSPDPTLNVKNINFDERHNASLEGKGRRESVISKKTLIIYTLAQVEADSLPFIHRNINAACSYTT